MNYEVRTPIPIHIRLTEGHPIQSALTKKRSRIERIPEENRRICLSETVAGINIRIDQSIMFNGKMEYELYLPQCAGTEAEQAHFAVLVSHFFPEIARTLFKGDPSSQVVPLDGMSLDEMQQFLRGLETRIRELDALFQQRLAAIMQESRAGLKQDIRINKQDTRKLHDLVIASLAAELAWQIRRKVMYQ